MSRAGEFTIALAAISAALLHEVRTVQENAPRPVPFVTIGDTIFAASPDTLAAMAGFNVAWLFAPSLRMAPTTAAAPYTELAPSFVFERLFARPPIFVDRFQGIDETRRWAISDGWTNGAWTATDWSRRQVRSGANGLSITLASNQGGGGQPFASGEISTHETYRYGYFESRLRMPRGSGLVAGVFTFTRDAGPESWHEIDMEILGRDTRALELTYYVAGRENKHVVPLPFDAADGFHTYAFDWQRDAIRWYVDDELVYEAREGVEQMTRPQRFIVNLWNSEQLQSWVGPIDRASGPWTLNVACVAHAEGYPGQSICDGG